MLINLRGHDVRHVLGVEFGELDPGIELREGGFFVPKMDDVPDFASDDVEVLLDGRDAGDCLLELPASVDAFLDFAEGYPAIKDRIDPRKLIRRIEQAAWVQARSDATEEGQFHWSAISQVFALRRDLQHKHDRTENDSRKVALREVLDALGKILPDPEDVEPLQEVTSEWPWGTHTTSLLNEFAAAGRKYWANYDPGDATTAPTNDEVVKWLVGRSVALRNAQVMATMLRADGLAPGPRA